MSALNHSPYDVENPCQHDNPPYYLTAYGLAVKLGFRGTEEEWLESLRYEGGAAKVVALGASNEKTTDGVGFGTCIVMHDRKNCLVFDLGNDQGATLKEYLDQNGIKTIDAIFISHFHSDHYQLATLQELLKGYSVGSIVLPHTGIEWERESIKEDTDYQWYRSCCEAAEQAAGGICCKPAEGAVYSYGGFSVSCHNVDAFPDGYYSWNYSELLSHLDENGNEKAPKYNNFSMVNGVTVAGHKIVVTGDIMEPAIARTIDVLNGAELIFVPHHGADIRIPPSAFHRLTAGHAVINAAWDKNAYLLNTSRAFAGELLKKGCRVTTTYNGAPAGYFIGEEIVPAEPGILAGNEIYPCALLPGEDLDTLPDGEYITYSEAIARTIRNRPPFTVEPARKFKVKVETTYITGGWNRTQMAYTIDTSTRPEAARRNCSSDTGRYYDWLLDIGSGQFYAVLEVPDDPTLDDALRSIIAAMPNQSYRKVVLSFTNVLESLGIGSHWDTEIYKLSTNYANITAKSYIFHGTALQRVWHKNGADDDPDAVGVLNPWEWENPPMYEDVEYRTTQRMYGKAVYRKISGGKKYYRLDGEEEWTVEDAVDPVTADHTGNKENPHEVTAKQVGAAPSGYGLGEGNSTPKDWNASVHNAFVREATNSADGEWWFGINCKDYGNYTAQIAFKRGTAGAPMSMAIRKRAGISFNAWEYVNPPMVEGVEYQTIERYNGKAVYTKLVNLELDDYGGHNQIPVADGVVDLVDAKLSVREPEGFVYFNPEGYPWNVFVDPYKTCFCDFTARDAENEVTVMVQIKYTKE